ncbi:MAG: hypothetical protein JSW20_14395 [Nitrospiraceae bacterium]|nr:MAG: hypothetical protein JSW20_14395 [Nitrospiraceae bacterium]
MNKYVLFLITVLLTLCFSNYSHALCVNVAEANLRSGAGTKFEKTWEVFKYMPFDKITKKGNWYQVKDVDGDVHWIYEKLVTSKIKCAVVKVDKANVRKGPGEKYGKTSMSPALKYDSFKVIKTQSPWVNVIDEFGDSGWIFRKLLWIQ